MSKFQRSFFKETRQRITEMTSDKTWWVFVWNSPTDYKVPETLKDVLEVWWQLEEGSVKHRPHLQGVAHFAFPKSRQQLREQLPGWWQVMQGTPAQAVRYCTKDTGRLDGPWHWAFYTPYFASLDAILHKPESPFKGQPLYGLLVGPLPVDAVTRPMIEQADKPFNALLTKTGFIKA